MGVSNPFPSDPLVASLPWITGWGILTLSHRSSYSLSRLYAHLYTSQANYHTVRLLPPGPFNRKDLNGPSFATLPELSPGLSPNTLK